MKKDLSVWDKIKRPVEYRLVVPLKRSVQDPVILARGVLVGMMWAMTPLVGIQMTMVLITWIIAKKLNWSFSLPIAIAFTWVTNVFTMVPVYYVFYVTGKLMMGDWHNITGWESVKNIVETTFFGDYTMWESIVLFGKMLLKDWGLAMALGCIPWSIGLGWISYRWSLKFLRIWQEKRSKAAEKRHYWRSTLSKVMHPKQTLQQVKQNRQKKKRKKKKNGKKRFVNYSRH